MRFSDIKKTVPNPRPEWLDSLRRPLLALSLYEPTVGAFCILWRFRSSEVKRVTDVFQIEGIRNKPLLAFPGWQHNSGLLYVGRTYQTRGELLIELPESILKGEPFTEEFSLIVSTKLQMAKRQHGFRLTKAKVAQ
jgi:hypothetical protein